MAARKTESLEDRGSVVAGTQKRKRNSTAVEPDTFVGQIKICPFCGEATECHNFKYCNNKKSNQPRYKCRKCTKLFSPNRMRPKVFVSGYNKKQQQHSGEEEFTLSDEMLLAQCSQQLEVGQKTGATGELLATNLPTGYDPSMVEATSYVEVVASNDICKSGVQYAPQVVPEEENIFHFMDEQKTIFTSYGLRNERSDASIYGPGEPTIQPSFDWCLEPLTSMDWIDSEVPDVYFGVEEIDEEVML